MKTKKKIKKTQNYTRALIGFAVFCFLILPFVAEAEVSVKSLITKASGLVADIIILLMMVAVVVFIWGVVRFIAAGGSSEKIKTAKGLIIWGLVGLFVLFSFLGIIKILQNTVFEDEPSPSPIQTVT